METLTVDRIVTLNVDVQNDFCPGGALAVTDGDEVITPLNALNDFTRENGGIVVASGDQHPQETPHFGPDAWPVHCVAGTEGAELHKDLNILPTDIIVDKGMGQTDGYSAFEGITRQGETLESLVAPHGRERVALLIGGLATDYCVKNSAIDATKVPQGEGRLYVLVIEDAMRAVNLQPTDGEEAIKEMEAAGARMVESVDILTGRALELAK
ncbi:TPA: nicotinamidase [Candidatus Saccharibacteria bacterium]|nr:nicotinamidase [Candidatus Saccharibacteria bacterium]|tara:strand:- start:1760 stop:2395 length:636 start_codon:yes stop_codon:yes gene_type:complete